MKKFNKVLAVALAVLMLAMTAVPAFADYWALTLDEVLCIDVPRRGSEVWVFVPEHDGCVSISTHPLDEYPNADPVITVYDAYGNEIAYCDDYWEDVDYAAVVEFYAVAGDEYYIYFSEANGKKVTYGALAYYSCYDWDADGYCDGCLARLCFCDCHEGGIVGFFWSIKNFFNMIFGLDEYCVCNYAHW